MTTPLHPTGIRALPRGIDGLAREAGVRSTIQGLRDLLTGLPDEMLLLGQCASFDPVERTRRVLREDDHACIALFGWLPGQRTDAHAHRGSLCAFRVLRGVAIEARYELNADGYAIEVGRDHYLPGSVIVCDGANIHALMNDNAASEPVVTLHIYRPSARMTTYPILQWDMS